MIHWGCRHGADSKTVLLYFLGRLTKSLSSLAHPLQLILCLEHAVLSNLTLLLVKLRLWFDPLLFPVAKFFTEWNWKVRIGWVIFILVPNSNRHQRFLKKYRALRRLEIETQYDCSMCMSMCRMWAAFGPLHPFLFLPFFFLPSFFPSFFSPFLQS